MARLLSDGTLDPTFDPGYGIENGWTEAVAVQPDGKVILGGWFTLAQRFGRLRLARLNADGTLDTTFLPSIGFNSDVLTLSLQSDGRIIAGGYFSTSNGVATNHVARMLGDNGTTPTAFEQWKINYGISASAADAYDPESDGVPLLLEYALGLNPQTIDRAALPTATFSGSSLQMSYQRVRSDVSYRVESSADLQNWSANGVNQGTPSSTVTAIAPFDGTTNLFLRLRVARP